MPVRKPEEPLDGREQNYIWNFSAPHRLPEMRGKLATWLSERGADFYLESLIVGSQQIRPPGPLSQSATRLAEQEHHRVTEGELFWVSADMTELARHAGRRLTRHELFEHDLPDRCGFMVFETPLADSCVDGLRLEIVAVSWGLIEPPLLVTEGSREVPVGSRWATGVGVWFTFYSDPNGFLEANLQNLTEVRLVWRRQTGPFLPDNELVWALNQPEDLPEEEDVTSAWGRTVVAAWLLMQQPLASHGTERALRPARRRLTKAGLPTDDVRLVRVRRPEPRATDSRPGAGREYSVRWWVEGHWRRYRCGPGRERVERRWISPYLAGPGDKPVQGAQRVKIWDR
ncbi:hypothetical protein GCM10022254_74890 [Actinomadura meridiana]|uniref:Uncharacterized protein n=1 Tax=Actinomadura meridiana TaxID=559626 RepID=A0ABP8CRA9_9ACTN